MQKNGTPRQNRAATPTCGRVKKEDTLSVNRTPGRRSMREKSESEAETPGRIRRSARGKAGSDAGTCERYYKNVFLAG